jgi:hypothetical protein
VQTGTPLQLEVAASPASYDVAAIMPLDPIALVASFDVVTAVIAADSIVVAKPVDAVATRPARHHIRLRTSVQWIVHCVRPGNRDAFVEAHIRDRMSCARDSRNKQ